MNGKSQGMGILKMCAIQYSSQSDRDRCIAIQKQIPNRIQETAIPKLQMPLKSSTLAQVESSAPLNVHLHLLVVFLFLVENGLVLLLIRAEVRGGSIRCVVV